MHLFVFRWLLSVGSSFSSSCTSGTAGGGARGSGAGGMSNLFDFSFLLTCCARQVVERFARTQLIHPFVLTRCSSERSLLPSHTAVFHLSASLSAGFPDPVPTSGRGSSTDSPNSSNFPTIRTTERRLRIVISEARNEPSCVSNNSFHQCQWSNCVACGLAVLPTVCAFVPATVADSFPLLRCCDEIVWESFG